MELGDESAIQFVAMATPEDIRANAEFVRLADTFVEVPGGKNLNNYANVTVISQVAKEQGECFHLYHLSLPLLLRRRRGMAWLGTCQ